MRINNKGFSLPIAMGLVIVITLLAFTILEYIVPFSRDIKGIENSTNAFFQANSGVEEVLYKIYERNYEGVGELTDEYNSIFSGEKSFSYTTSSSGKTLPPVGQGTSDYDTDWNTISTGNPVQIYVGNNYLSSDQLDIAFKVPNISPSDDEVLVGGSLAIVNWQLSSLDNTLNSKSGTIVEANEVLSGDDISNSFISFRIRDGVDLDGNSYSIGNFYENECINATDDCILKISIVNKLEFNNNGSITSLPYLEWKINISDLSSKNLPLRYTTIKSSGKSYGFKKDIEIKIPAPSVNEAFDFTVFQ